MTVINVFLFKLKIRLKVVHYCFNFISDSVAMLYFNSIIQAILEIDLIYKEFCRWVIFKYWKGILNNFFTYFLLNKLLFQHFFFTNITNKFSCWYFIMKRSYYWQSYKESMNNIKIKNYNTLQKYTIIRNYQKVRCSQILVKKKKKILIIYECSKICKADSV